MASPISALKPIALIIDDDPLMRLFTRDALEEFGWQVEEASDGQSGLSIFVSRCPDIVLLDVQMPGMDGFAVCRALRDLPDGKLIPVIMFTGLGDTDSIDSAYNSGATDFIEKPINQTILGHRVRYMLNASCLLKKVSKSEAKLSHAQRISSVGSWEWSAAEDIISCSEEMYRICGVQPETVGDVYQEFLDLVHPEDKGKVETSIQTALFKREPYNVEHRIVRANGSIRTVHGHGEIFWDVNGKPISVVGTLQDITERKRDEDRINHLANYDPLTNLPNRNLLNDRVAQMIALAQRTGECLMMLCLDLDGFKFINDSFGHAAGDELLKIVATRLQAAVRDCDTVARLGGDEFIIILLGVNHNRDVSILAEKILATFSENFIVGDHEMHVTASIGVSIFPDDGDTSGILMKNADVAMYSAKKKGRNCFQFYASEMSFYAEQRVALENALRMAVANEEFEVYFQPKIDLRNGQVKGVEALVRWQRPGIGLVSPDSFIALAEETGLILPIGEHVLRIACQQTKKWHDMGYPDLSVAVNLSARQFEQQDIAELIRQILADTGLDAQYLELELTESLLMNGSDGMLAILGQLKSIGVLLTLDDFGTGYSSLSYLKRFPIDVLKIDRSFIKDVTCDVDDALLTKAIIQLAQSLKMKTIAEGVETEGQLSFLNTNKCDMVQGYYFSKPMLPEELEQTLQLSAHALNFDDPTKQRQTLLLLDDDPNVIAALYRLFRHDQYLILKAATASEAFELLALHSVQVIISDQRMPQMSGTDFFEKVKEMYPEVIRIILSGYAEIKSVIDAINHGAVYQFFLKPWDDQILREHIRAAFHYYWKMHGKPFNLEEATHCANFEYCSSGFILPSWVKKREF